MSAAKKPRASKAPAKKPRASKAPAKKPRASKAPAKKPRAANAPAKRARARRAAPAPLVRGGRASGPIRLSANPEDVERSVVQLVLTLVEFVRELMERQAIRRVDVGDLTDAQVEAVGSSLMVLEKTVHKLAKRFDLRPEDLDLDLGPLGRLRG